MEIEGSRLIEDARIARRCAPREQDAVSLLHLNAMQLDVLPSRAPEDEERGEHPERLFDRGRNECRIRTELCEYLRMCSPGS